MLRHFVAFVGVMIRRASETTPHAGPTNGRLITDTRNTADSAFTLGSTYSYALFAHYSGNHYAKGDWITVTLETSDPVDVSSVLTQDITRTPDASPAYIFRGNLSVFAVVTLLGEARNAKIMVQRTLAIVGTMASRVPFTSLDDGAIGGHTWTGDPAAGTWSGIASGSRGSIDIEHASVSYAGLAIGADGPGSPTLFDDTFSIDNSGAVLANGPAALVIIGDTFALPGKGGGGHRRHGHSHGRERHSDQSGGECPGVRRRRPRAEPSPAGR